MTHLIGAHGAMRKVIHHMHRDTLVDLEADQFSAPEGARQVQATPVPPKPEQAPVASFWRVAGVFTLAVFGLILLISWGAK